MNKASRLFVLFVSLFAATGAGAQDYPAPYFQSNAPVFPGKDIPLAAGDTGIAERILYKEVIIEYRYNEKNEFQQIRTERWKVKIESERGLESYNKLYINLNNAISLEEASARVVSSAGSVTTMDKEKMIEEKQFKEYGRYYYFALDGLDIGSTIEFTYTISVDPGYNGNRFIVADDIPVYNCHFRLIAPDNLLFSFKVINDLPLPAKDSTDTLRNNWYSFTPYIPAFREEAYSVLKPIYHAYYYKLDENKAMNKKNVSSFSWAAQNIFESIYPGADKDLAKNFDKLGKEFSIAKFEGEDRIRELEHYIKTHVFLAEGNDASLRDMNVMLKTKVADEVGLVRLFANWLNHLGIKHQLVLTCDRMDQFFDKDYQSYSYLQEYLIYFPEYKTFIVPANRVYRYSLVPEEFTGHYGLFISSVEVGGIMTGVPSVKMIPEADYRASVDSTIYEIDVSSFEDPRIKTYKSLTGYEGAGLHANMDHYSEEQKKEVCESIIKNIRDDEELISVETENSSEADAGRKALVFKGEIKYPNLVSVADDNYLIHIGSVIGLQVELYDEKERMNPIEMNFNHMYDRTIILNIPAGYEVRNVEALDITRTYEIDGQEKMGFKSSFEIANNKLIFRNVEYYNILRFGKEHFQGFRSVINAAADFNKAVVVLSPVKK